ncbi:hypothetical protein Tco_1406165 [Tanacetum coccineum]
MILTTNTPYLSRKIRRIRACTHQRPQRNEAQYAVLKIVDDDLYDLRSVEAEFPAIVIDDTFAPQDALSCKSQIWHHYHHVRRHPFLRYQGLEYTNADIADFEERLERIYSREIHRVQVVDFQGMSELIRDGLFTRMVMEHHDDVSVVVFTSRAWGRLFDTRGPLVKELILEFLSTLRFREVLLDLDVPGTIQFQLGRSRRRLSWRQFILTLGITYRGRDGVPRFC